MKNKQVLLSNFFNNYENPFENGNPWVFTQGENGHWHVRPQEPKQDVEGKVIVLKNAMYMEGRCIYSAMKKSDMEKLLNSSVDKIFYQGLLSKLVNEPPMEDVELVATKVYFHQGMFCIFQFDENTFVSAPVGFNIDGHYWDLDSAALCLYEKTNVQFPKGMLGYIDKNDNEALKDVIESGCYDDGPYSHVYFDIFLNKEECQKVINVHSKYENMNFDLIAKEYPLKDDVLNEEELKKIGLRTADVTMLEFCPELLKHNFRYRDLVEEKKKVEEKKPLSFRR